MQRALLATVAVLGLAGATVAVHDLVLCQPPTPKHIVLVSIDTLRADVLSMYPGHPRVQTPRLQQLADQGIVFERHYSAAPTTLASHTALFTGDYPHTHGVPRNDHLVDDSNRMLPERLKNLGFDTAAFLGAMPLASHSNFPQGFDHLDEDFTVHRHHDETDQTMREGDQVTDRALAWAAEWSERRGDDGRLFLFAHYFDVHAPYVPPPKYRDLYDVDPKITTEGTMDHVHKVQRAFQRNDPRAEAAGANLVELYYGGVTYADHHVGRLFQGLKEQGILDDALVIVTSDHGETFYDHEEVFDHGRTVYDETVHTPLIVRFPDGWGGGRRVADVVSNTDVLPTLARLLGADAGDTDGVDFFGALAGRWLRPARAPVFAEATKPWVVGKHWQNDPMAKMVRDGDRKLILEPRKGDRQQLFHVDDDPRELNDLAATLPDEAASLGTVLETWRRQADPRPSPRSSDSRVQAELAALGYVDDAAGGDDSGKGKRGRKGKKGDAAPDEGGED